MKSLITTAFILISAYSFSQDSIAYAAPTTEEEYNYITKGYQVQISSGLDMKKGYSFVDLHKTKIDGFDFDYKVLIRESSGDVASVMTIIYSNATKNTYYVCLPHQNQVLLNRYYSFIDQWNEKMIKAYLKANSTLLPVTTMLLVRSENKK